jgi:Multicopper oxidase
MSGSIFILFACLCFALQTYARTVTYNWNLNWVTVNPDGELPRPAVGINGKWPNPAIEAQVGDRIIINLRNQLGNETSSIHFHGIYQKGSNGMDGPPAVTQCQIPPGSSFTYDFVVRLLHTMRSGYSANSLPGEPTRVLLVSLTYNWTDVRWIAWTADRQGSAFAVRW